MHLPLGFGSFDLSVRLAPDLPLGDEYRMHVLLTGATGQLGRYLLRDLLLAEVPVAVLMRARGKESGSDRLQKLVEFWEADPELDRPLPRPVCLEGDVREPHLGLNAESRRWAARHCDAFLHNAASLNFFGKDRAGEPWRSNFTGTANVLDFCKLTGIRRLHHVSTAYVCGRHDGPGSAREDELDRGQSFRNDYEECKFEAEKLVHGADFLDQRTIYRPAIIVGDSRTGYTATYHGLFSYFQFLSLYLQHVQPDPDGRYPCHIRLNLTGAEERNLVCVDWVSNAMTHILLAPDHHGRTYHLTPWQPTTAAEIESAMAAFFNIYGPRFAGPHALEDGTELNDLERFFYSYLERYQPYWNQEPHFDCRNTLAAVPQLPCPKVDRASMIRMMEFAVADRWGKGPVPSRESRKLVPA